MKVITADIKKKSKEKTKQTMLKAITIFCLLGTIAFIFSNSLQIGEISGGKSQIVMDYLNEALAKSGSQFRFSAYFIRKLAHFCEFALLGFWLILTLRAYTKRTFFYISWPLFAGLFVAVSDEFLQAFVDGRGSSVIDVAIDFGGVLAGIVFAYLTLFLAAKIIKAPRKKKKI